MFAAPSKGGSQPQAGGMGGMPGGDMMAQLLPYLPKILGIAKQAPGFIFGYVFTILFFLIVYGPQRFKLEIAPVAGFHVVALVILAHVVPIVMASLATIRAAQGRAKEVDRLSSDIKMKQQRLNQNDLD
eukprot:GILI01038167.1.p1 GENE.GILI01038167.1~~GILI01038167.1.p1  ORF type:complete len:129 (+),score=21.24 GILI01038167.1:52-438(+)